MIASRPTAAEQRVAADLWGSRPNSEVPRPRLRLISWKPLPQNSLRGFATVDLPIGLKISDIPVLVSNGKARARLPSKPQVDSDGQHKKGINGKPAYTAILEWRDRDLADPALVASFGGDRFPELPLRLVRERR